MPPSTAAATNTSALFGIFRCGWGLSTNAGLQWRHRAHRVLRLILDPRHGAALARRSVRVRVPMGRGACAFGSAPPATPPGTGTGVVTFLMG